MSQFKKYACNTLLASMCLSMAGSPADAGWLRDRIKQKLQGAGNGVTSTFTGVSNAYHSISCSTKADLWEVAGGGIELYAATHRGATMAQYLQAREAKIEAKAQEDGVSPGEVSQFLAKYKEMATKKLATIATRHPHLLRFGLLAGGYWVFHMARRNKDMALVAEGKGGMLSSHNGNKALKKVLKKMPRDLNASPQDVAATIAELDGNSQLCGLVGRPLEEKTIASRVASRIRQKRGYSDASGSGFIHTADASERTTFGTAVGGQSTVSAGGGAVGTL